MTCSTISWIIQSHLWISYIKCKKRTSRMKEKPHLVSLVHASWMSDQVSGVSLDTNPTFQSRSYNIKIYQYKWHLISNQKSRRSSFLDFTDQFLLKNVKIEDRHFVSKTLPSIQLCYEKQEDIVCEERSPHGLSSFTSPLSLSVNLVKNFQFSQFIITTLHVGTEVEGVAKV